MPPRPIILYNLCFSLVDDDFFKEPMKKRRRSDRDQRFRAFPSVEQSTLKECECHERALPLVLMWLCSFPNVLTGSEEEKVTLRSRMGHLRMIPIQKRRPPSLCRDNIIWQLISQNLDRRLVTKIISSWLELWMKNGCFGSFMGIYMMSLHFFSFYDHRREESRRATAHGKAYVTSVTLSLRAGWLHGMPSLSMIAVPQAIISVR